MGLRKEMAIRFGGIGKGLKRFLYDQRAMALEKTSIRLVVTLLVLLVTLPVVVDQVQNLNTTGWTFTGAAGAKTLISLIPFVWVGAIVLVIVGAAYAWKSGK